MNMTKSKINQENSDLAFVTAYFENNMNATRAYMQLHPKVSYASAKAISSEILTKLNIQNEITHILKSKAMSVEEALARTGDIARASQMPFIRIDEDGFVYFNFADPEAKANMHIIKKIKAKRERRIEGRGENAEKWEGEWVEVELFDAQAAQRDILKMHGKFIEKMEIKNSGEVILRVVREDIKKIDAS